MDMAGLRTGPRAVPIRGRPLCRGAAPGHRRRRRDQRSNRRAAWRGGLLCRLGPDQRPDRHDRDSGRVFGHPRPPRVDHRHARGSGRRRRDPRGDRALRHPRTCRCLRAHGRPDDHRPERLPRPARLPASACGGARERALLVAGEATRADGEGSAAAVSGSCSCEYAGDCSRPRIGSAACHHRDGRGRDGVGRAARAGRGRRRRSRPGDVVNSRLGGGSCCPPGAGRASCRRRASAAGGIPPDHVDPLTAGTRCKAKTARRRAGLRPVPDGGPGTPTVGSAGVEPSRRPQDGSRRGHGRAAPSLGDDRARRSTPSRRRARSLRSAGHSAEERGAGAAGDDTHRVSDSHAGARARGARSRGFGDCDLATPPGPTIGGAQGGPRGATYHLWRCAST
jgi:hypothetical protein